jgi:hypothetical protein
MDARPTLPDTADMFGDVELRMAGRLGPKSWEAQVIRGPGHGARAVIHTLSEAVTFKPAATIRILDATLGWNQEEREALVATMTAWSEVYVLA